MLATDHSLDEVIYKTKFSLKSPEKKPKAKFERARTFTTTKMDKEGRFDNWGSTIKKGGNHKICFKDKIGIDGQLCEVVNITLLKKKETLLHQVNSKLRRSSSIESNKNSHTGSTKKTKSSENDENCSCACNIF